MEVPVCLDGRRVGTLYVEPAGTDTSFRAACTGLPAGLYRLYVCGVGGQLLLGVTEDGFPWPVPAGALLHREGGSTRLAAPWPPEAPFPLTELFCFAAVTHREGRRTVLYTFSGGWTPQLPPR